MDREQLMHEMIDGMDEEEALALCEELGEELPEQSLEVAQIALRMHYSQNQGQGLHVTPEGTVPLANFLMGDGQVRAYAEGLRRLGAQGVVIRRLELANNALTDQGLVPLARALKCCSRLEHLDLSSNRIRREGCDALGRYLVDPNDEDGGCAISTLLMSKNNMGEGAARSILAAMRDQVTVTELDLSSNKVGGGGVGQSLAELLEDNTTLQVRVRRLPFRLHVLKRLRLRQRSVWSSAGTQSRARCASASPRRSDGTRRCSTSGYSGMPSATRAALPSATTSAGPCQRNSPIDA